MTEESVFENIILEYPVRILRDNGEMYRARMGIEVFMDEQGIQWVKFVPDNSYLAGHEHMIRTDRCVIVRDALPQRGSVKLGAPIGATLGPPRPA